MENHSAWELEPDDWELESDPWQLEEPFNLARAKQGVSGEARIHVFHQYLGWCIKQGYTRIDAKMELIAWNACNHPPLPWVEFDHEFERCWKMWAKAPKK